jgi:hypothetical protein
VAVLRVSGSFEHASRDEDTATPTTHDEAAEPPTMDSLLVEEPIFAGDTLKRSVPKQ